MPSFPLVAVFEGKEPSVPRKKSVCGFSEDALPRADFPSFRVFLRFPRIVRINFSVRPKAVSEVSGVGAWLVLNKDERFVRWRFSCARISAGSIARELPTAFRQRVRIDAGAVRFLLQLEIRFPQGDAADAP